MSKRQRSSDDKETAKMLADMQKAEDQIVAERRKRLSNGFSRALLHLSKDEMASIEEVVWRAIGRSVILR